MAQLHFLKDIFSNDGGMFAGRDEVGVLLGNPRTLKTNFKTLGEARKEIVDMGLVGVIMQVRGKFGNINWGGGRQCGQINRYGFGGMVRATNCLRLGLIE